MTDRGQAKRSLPKLLGTAVLLSTTSACDQRHLVIGAPYEAKDARAESRDAGTLSDDLDAARERVQLDAQVDSMLDARADPMSALTAQLAFFERGPVVALMPGCDAGCAQLRVDVAGGSKPYAFVWDDGETGATINVCSTDRHLMVDPDTLLSYPAERTVRVTDAKGGMGIQLRVESLSTCSSATTVCYACRRLDTLCPEQAARGTVVLPLGTERPSGANVRVDLYLKWSMGADAGSPVVLSVSASQDGCNATPSSEGYVPAYLTDDPR
ncbi:MAG: hypothetical protein RLZZ450_2953 [Pseudomonadota bacterium]|jgi:hypothetical protein